MTEILQTLINNVKSNVPGYIALCVTDLSSGEALASDTMSKDFDPVLASAYNLEVVKAKLNAIKALGIQEEIRDISITLSNQVHIISVAPSGTYFIYLAVSSESANMGITKTLLNKYKENLNNEL